MINLSLPNLSKEEIKVSSSTIRDGWVAGGKFIKKFEDKVRNFTKAKYAISCINGTSALHLALRVIGASSNNEILMPSVSFIATANATIYNNSSPIFLDVDKYLNLDPLSLEKFIRNQTFKKNGTLYNKKSKKKILAVVVVHVYGIAANITDIQKICKKNNLLLIEDAAGALGSFYKKNGLKKHLGTFGDLGCFSFNANKIITSGGGGMVVTNNVKLANKVRFLSNQAKENDTFYIHSEVGYNYRLPNINCSIGFAQLKKLKSFINIKKKNFYIYSKMLNKDKIELVDSPEYSQSNKWMYVVRFKTKKNIIKKVIKYLKEKGIETKPIWTPLINQPKFFKFEKHEIFNMKKSIFNKLCIPSSTFLKKNEIKFVADKINLFADKEL